jgi:hypothetical protein
MVLMIDGEVGATRFDMQMIVLEPLCLDSNYESNSPYKQQCYCISIINSACFGILTKFVVDEIANNGVLLV